MNSISRTPNRATNCLVDQVFGVLISLLLLLAAPFGIVQAASSFTATTAISAAGDPTYAIIQYFRGDGDYGDHTTGDYNDFWGLHPGVRASTPVR